jgi:hypothetical protein
MALPIETIFFLLLFLGIVALAWYYHARALDARNTPPLRRPFPQFQPLRDALGRGAETGHAIHLSPGAGTIGNHTTMGQTVAGLLAAEHVANEAAQHGAPILVSSGDAVAHLALRGILRQAYRRAGRAHDYDPSSAQLLAHQNETAYATGVMTLYARQKLEASQLIGSFGREFLLFGEEGAARAIPQIIGTTSVDALPVTMINTPYTLLGEEVFAAEAYLTEEKAPQARLVTQDTLRTVVILLIIGGVIYHVLQPTFGWPPLPGMASVR